MEWQSTDKLPDDFEALFYTSTGGIKVEETAYVRHLMWHAKKTGDTPYYTHWMPLPPPPNA